MIKQQHKCLNCFDSTFDRKINSTLNNCFKEVEEKAKKINKCVKN